MIGHPVYYICAINIFSCGVMFLYVVQNLLTIHAYTTRVINNYFDALFIGQLYVCTTVFGNLHRCFLKRPKAR